ncbi:MAG TPA: hypothetical protein VGG41_15880, partial [Solirubrobacteraceae bacterium]
MCPDGVRRQGGQLPSLIDEFHRILVVWVQQIIVASDHEVEGRRGAVEVMPEHLSPHEGANECPYEYAQTEPLQR